jgi:hypothetical protein
MIETALDGIPANRHFGPQCLEQRSSATEAGDFDIEFGAIQSVGDMNKLPLGSPDVEMVQKLQKSYSLHRHIS